MFVYLVKFAKYQNAIKIGKATRLEERLRALEKTHGDVVHVRYINCLNEQLSLEVEAILHSTFQDHEQIFPDMEYDDDHCVISGDGRYEFFVEEAVLKRMSWLESWVVPFGLKLSFGSFPKVKSGTKRIIEEISLKELYILDVKNLVWYTENILWGEYQERKGDVFDLDMQISKKISNNKDFFDAVVEENIRIEKELSSLFIESLNFSKKYLDKASTQSVFKQVRFMEVHSGAQLLLERDPNFDFNKKYDDPVINKHLEKINKILNQKLVDEIREKPYPILNFDKVSEISENKAISDII